MMSGLENRLRLFDLIALRLAVPFVVYFVSGMHEHQISDGSHVVSQVLSRKSPWKTLIVLPALTSWVVVYALLSLFFQASFMQR